MQAVKEHVQNAIATAQGIYEKAHAVYTNAINSVDVTVQKAVPESLRPLVSRIIQALPETLFCACLFVNIARPLTTLFWLAKTVYVITPMVSTVIQWKVKKEETDEAWGEVKARFQETVDACKPALFTSCAVMSTFSGVFGLLTYSPELLKQAALFGLMSHIFYQSTNALIGSEVKVAKKVVETTTPPPAATSI